MYSPLANSVKEGENSTNVNAWVLGLSKTNGSPSCSSLASRIVYSLKSRLPASIPQSSTKQWGVSYLTLSNENVLSEVKLSSSILSHEIRQITAIKIDR